MTLRRRTALPVLAALALVLMGAGPSVGERIAAGQQPSPPVTPDPAVPCQDDRAVLVATGAGGVVFRCVGGVPVPREGPWSTPGCARDYEPEAVYVKGPPDGWQPDTACLITQPVDVVPALPPRPGRSEGYAEPAPG